MRETDLGIPGTTCNNSLESTCGAFMHNQHKEDFVSNMVQYIHSLLCHLLDKYLAGLLADLDPVQMSVLWFVHYVPTAVKAKDVVTNTACPA